MLTAPQFSPERLKSVLARIETAARRAGREPASVRLLAVRKDIARINTELRAREIAAAEALENQRENA